MSLPGAGPIVVPTVADSFVEHRRGRAGAPALVEEPPAAVGRAA